MLTQEPADFPRIYYLPHRYVGAAADIPAHLARCRQMGFAQVLLTPPFRAAENGDCFLTADHERLDESLNSTRDAPEFLHWLAQECEKQELALLLDLPVDQLAAEHPLVSEIEDCFAVRRESYAHAVDPRREFRASGSALARFSESRCVERLIEWWASKMRQYLDLGLAGFRFLRPGALSPENWALLMAAARGPSHRGLFIASTYGMGRDAVHRLEGCGFDHVQTSLPWWDLKSSWLVEEYDALRGVAPPIAAPEDPLGARLYREGLSPRRQKIVYERMLTLACSTGCGMMVPMGFEYGMAAPFDPRRSREADFAQAVSERPFDLANQLRAANAFLRQETALQRCGSLRGLTGPNSRVTAMLRGGPAQGADDDALLILVNPDPEQPSRIHDWRIVPGIGAVAESVQPLEPQTPDEEMKNDASVLLAPGEVRILRVGRDKPIKSRLTSRRSLAAAAKAPRIILDDILPGRADGYSVKHVIGAAIRVEANVLCDGDPWLSVELQWRASDETAWHRQRMNFIGAERWCATFFLSRLGTYEFAVEAWIDRYGSFQQQLFERVEARVDLAPFLEQGRGMLAAAASLSEGQAADSLAEALRGFDALTEEERAALLLAPSTAERVAAAGDRPFAARSGVHHVEAERTAAAFGSWLDMRLADGFDETAFGEIVRLLPRLRPLGFDILSLSLPHLATPQQHADDWRALFAAAQRSGLEIAIEFPPPEEPPQDAAESGFDLTDWTALHAVLLAWSQAGLGIFRLRKPTNMPFAFWQWAIADIKRGNPSAVFVAGASGHDKIAHQLARQGFSQAELPLPWSTDKLGTMHYLSALHSKRLQGTFRPHFRIGARAGRLAGESDVLARCALAATLAGSWSVSEEIAGTRAAARPVLAGAISRLNWIRRSNPVLQSHHGLTFYNAYDPRVIYYGRSTAEREDIILVAVNMAPHLAIESEFELPLWEWGLPDHAAVQVEDLFTERRFVWHGKIQRTKLDAQRYPFAIWRIQPQR